MKITSRLIFSLLAVITLAVASLTWLQTRHEKSQLLEDMTRSSSILAAGMRGLVAPALADANQRELTRVVEEFGARDNVIAVGIYKGNGSPLAITQKSASVLPNFQPFIQRVAREGAEKSVLWESPKGTAIHAYAVPVLMEANSRIVVAVFQRADSILLRVAYIWKESFMRLFIYALLISLTTVFIIRWNIMSPLNKAADWIRQLRMGEVDRVSHKGLPLPKELFGPLVKEVSHMAESLSSARFAAEEEARLRQNADALWTSERLKEHARTRLGQKPIFVIANREPYLHSRKGKEIQWITPASGLVTAIEPILRACGGTWIGHGSGDADKDVVDADDKIRVPPDDPQYSLRRIWLSNEEEAGYYYGFSNEGLWPLCHIAHTRPTFKASDWEQYAAVNQKFADAALKEMEGVEEPCVLIQDYHFALLPRLIKKKRPDARVGLFWHIPWPNPESFGICPWRRELLDGMLGADLIGFHIQYHCNNFLETIDRVLESRIDWERFTVERQDHTTWVKPLPISIMPPSQKQSSSVGPTKAELFKQLGIKADIMGIGVDRIDYTKGLVERFRAIERFLEKNEAYVGRFTFVELGAPSRELIKRYHDFIAEVEGEAERINARFQTKDWKPIAFLKKHHSHAEIEPYYKAADLCLVTSLHDGMNLVAKEYVATHGEKNGVLILSHFAGASRELRDALIVNPYDVEQMADAIRYAVEMPAEEQAARMQRMVKIIQERNIYRWAADLITELTNIRLRKVEKELVQV